MAAPFEATEEAAMRLNTVAEIAKEEGVPFLNYVKEWVALGWTQTLTFTMAVTSIIKVLLSFPALWDSIYHRIILCVIVEKLKDLYGMLRRQLLIKTKQSLS